MAQRIRQPARVSVVIRPANIRLRRKLKKQPDHARQLAAHLQWVRGFDCCVPAPHSKECSDRVEAAHVRNNLPPGEPGTERGIGLKPSAAWTVPLCSHHHREQHRIGEVPFCAKHGIDMVEIAQRLARMSPSLIKPRES